jgi:hypothetical protein
MILPATRLHPFYIIQPCPRDLSRRGIQLAFSANGHAHGERLAQQIPLIVRDGSATQKVGKIRSPISAEIGTGSFYLA